MEIINIMCQVRTQLPANNSSPTGKNKRKSSLAVKTSSTAANERPSRQKKSLQFSTIEVREYNRTLGDNPACSGGPPTQLDWEYAVTVNTTLDDYEENRAPLREKIDLALTPFMRRYTMHNDFGFSHEDITEACKGIQKIRRQRQRTKRMSVKMERRILAFTKIFRRVLFLRRKKIHYGVGAIDK